MITFSETDALPISVVIPTYRRGRLLIDTVHALTRQSRRADEIILVDQTETHEPEVSEELGQLARHNVIRWEHRDRPSIPAAMNHGLRIARNEVVLFLDDDIAPKDELVKAHWRAQKRAPLVAGRVLQPWHKDGDNIDNEEVFYFASAKGRWVEEFMGGNFSVRRSTALEVGGFDENFVGVAYRFEAEFAWRWRRRGHRILYGPSACIRHLKHESGGIRTYGRHLTTWRPEHAVGEYYFSLVSRDLPKRYNRILYRLGSSILTKHHMVRPWWVVPTLVAELRGLLLAYRLFRQGPKHV